MVPECHPPNANGCSKNSTAWRVNPRRGQGWGLAICREIIRAHDGRIGVTAAPGGRGSEFFFVLPVVTA